MVFFFDLIIAYNYCVVTETLQAPLFIVLLRQKRELVNDFIKSKSLDGESTTNFHTGWFPTHFTLGVSIPQYLILIIIMIPMLSK